MPEELDQLIAHSAPRSGSAQPLEEHLANVAHLATAFADSFHSAGFARWLGWWHDAGKVASDVQQYLRGETDWERGPDHSSTGMLKAWGDSSHPYLAANIAGHHGGLTDWDALKGRVQRKQTERRVEESLEHANRIIDPVAGDMPDTLPSFLRVKDKEARLRSMEMWLRMLHSTLVDADCLDTELHFDAEWGWGCVRSVALQTVAELRGFNRQGQSHSSRRR